MRQSLQKFKNSGSVLYLDENLMAMIGRLKTEFHRSARATKVGQN
jgi:hypothetical protein